MNVQQYEKLQKDLSDGISTRDKALGVVEQIESEWKEKHQLNTYEEVTAKVVELEKQKEDLGNKHQKLLDEAEKLMETNNA